MLPNCLGILDGLILAGYCAQDKRLEILRKQSAHIDSLKIITRLCFEVRAIDNRKYLSIQSKLNEVGRMLGGWIKHADKPQKVK